MKSYGMQLTEYEGAWEGKNRNGPIMLPAQYAMKTMALVTAFFVKPATLEEIMERLMGMPEA